ncbi:MAG: hypothetical protein DRN66_00590 [Candidatus Nanohalarchaeota archaeon]|nr:MAG: hypothetical protein DRN66_00590 [Candidatus Nanohaloarchaeota archaeon]
MLPKSLRDKKRYILCRLISDMEKNTGDMNKEIRVLFSKQVLSLYGDVGASKMNAKIIQVKDKEEGIYFMVMCNYNYVEHAEFALANIRELERGKIIADILGVSGTQKKLNTL